MLIGGDKRMIEKRALQFANALFNQMLGKGKANNKVHGHNPIKAVYLLEIKSKKNIDKKLDP